MPEIFAILLMAGAGVCALAGGINFFWRTGWKKALQISAFFVVMVLIFGLSGMWQGSSRHSWGGWTPVFALMLAGGWLGIRYAVRLWKYWRRKEKEAQDK